MPKLAPIEKALAKFEGSPTKMAAAIGGKVLRQHIEHWTKSGRVPTEHVRRVSELTGVGPWEFRPDDWFLIWPELVGQKGAPKVPAKESDRQAPDAPRSPTNHPGQRAGDKPAASAGNSRKAARA